MKTFNINFKIVRNNLLECSLETPYSYQDVIKELEKEEWQDDELTLGKSNDGLKNRFQLHEPNGEILKEIKLYMDSDEVKKLIIKNIYNFFPGIKNIWGNWSEEKMNECSLWGGTFIKDSPGFFISNHLDTRLTIAGLLIYLFKDHNPLKATVFYTDKNFSDAFVPNTSFGNGVLSVNDHDSWHSIHNRSNEHRFLLIHTLMLDVRNHSYFD
jgi:hypothetical protein